MNAEVKTGALALLAMVLVAVLRQLLPRVPKTLLPWVAALIAALGQLALLGGKAAPMQLIDAATYGLAASGLWSGGAKHLSGKAHRAVKHMTGAMSKAESDKPAS